MLVENAELKVPPSSLENQTSCLLNKMQHSIAELSSEVMGLKYCIDDNISNLASDRLSVSMMGGRNADKQMRLLLVVMH